MTFCIPVLIESSLMYHGDSRRFQKRKVVDQVVPGSARRAVTGLDSESDR